MTGAPVVALLIEGRRAVNLKEKRENIAIRRLCRIEDALERHRFLVANTVGLPSSGRAIAEAREGDIERTLSTPHSAVFLCFFRYSFLVCSPVGVPLASYAYRLVFVLRQSEEPGLRHRFRKLHVKGSANCTTKVLQTAL